MNDDRELERWQHEWQQGSSQPLDVGALLADTRRRNRREKVVTALELGFTLVVLAGCVLAASQPGLHTLERALVAALAVLLGCFSWWVYRQRRGNWSNEPANAVAILDLERRRQLTRLSYWRVSAWLVAGLWSVTLIAAGISRVSGSEDANHWLGTAFWCFIVVVFTVLGTLLVRRQVNRRLQRLDDLERTSR